MVDSLKFILVTQFAMFIVLFLDIPIARQVIGFIYLSFIPGFLVLKILKLELDNRIDQVVFSVSLSIAFLMFIGFIINELYPLIGFSKPLSFLCLLITISAVILLMSLIGYRRNVSFRPFSLPNKGLVLTGVLLFLLPFLAICGALLINNLILNMIVVLIVAVVVFTVFQKELIPTEAYPLILLAIALALMFQNEFVSRNLYGWDVFGEFHVFKLTQINSLWNPVPFMPTSELLDYNAMLSVTVLPTIYSNILSIQGEFIFKVVYYLFYALVPLSLYQMYKTKFGKTTAFLSAFYFVLFPRFYGEEKRQILGELFLVLLISLILNSDIPRRKRQILLCVFGCAIIVSHYSLSYIFLFLILFAWGIITIMTKLSSYKSNSRREKIINSRFVLLILIISILWYGFVSPPVAETFMGFADHSIASFVSGFASVETRDSAVSEFVAPNLGSMSLGYKIDWAINKIPYVLILVGFIALVGKYRKTKMQSEYFLMVLASISVLSLVLIVPAVSPAFLAERFFHVSLLFLAPVCVLGGVASLKLITRPFLKQKHERSFLQIVCILLVVIFLFKIGFVNEVIGDVPFHSSLNFTRMQTSQNPTIRALLYESYVPEEDIYGAVWLRNMVPTNSSIYADDTSRKHVLLVYGMIEIGWEDILPTNITKPDAYIYLRFLNSHGMLKGPTDFSNMTEVSEQLKRANMIYSNGGSEIYSLPNVTNP
jgi:uncharacterized membrane protein